MPVPIVHEKLRMLCGQRGIAAHDGRALAAIDPGAKRATFVKTVTDPVTRIETKSRIERPCDYLRHPDIFALVGVAGVPKGKTAASVKGTVPVVEDHLIVAIGAREGMAVWDGDTSCPMITRVGRAMLVQFDDTNTLVPLFPGIFAPWRRRR